MLKKTAKKFQKMRSVKVEVNKPPKKTFLFVSNISDGLDVFYYDSLILCFTLPYPLCTHAILTLNRILKPTQIYNLISALCSFSSLSWFAFAQQEQANVWTEWIQQPAVLCNLIQGQFLLSRPVKFWHFDLIWFGCLGLLSWEGENESKVVWMEMLFASVLLVWNESTFMWRLLPCLRDGTGRGGGLRGDTWTSLLFRVPC